MTATLGPEGVKKLLMDSGETEDFSDRAAAEYMAEVVRAETGQPK